MDNSETSAVWLLIDRSTFGKTARQGVDNGTNFLSFYLHYPPAYLLWVTVPPVLLVLGCFGNMMTIVVMRGMRGSESTACLSVYFTGLAVSDLFLLCSFVIWEWPEIAFNVPMTFLYGVSCAFPFFMVFYCSMMSAWFLMALTAQRLMSVVVPHRVGVLCTVRRGRIITAAVVTAGFLFNTYFFIIYHVERFDGFDACVSTDEHMANIFRYLHLSLASLIPSLFLIVANSVLISQAMQSIRISRQMKDKQQTSLRSAKVSSMTTTLILTSVTFLVLTLPTILLDVYLEMVGFFKGAVEDVGMNQRMALGDSVCIFLWISNSAVNFYIYILSGWKFRQEAKRHLCGSFNTKQSSMTRSTTN